MRSILHFAQDSDTSGFFPQLALHHARSRFQMVFGTLQPMAPWLRAHMEGQGVRCLDCACPGRAAYPLGLLRLIRYLRRERIDILHTHLFDPSVVGQLAGRIARTPALVLTRHYSDYHTRIHRPVHVALDRLSTALSHRVIAVSQHTADHLVGVERAPAGKVRVIPNGIDFDRIRPSGPDARPRVRVALGIGDAPVALIAGRFHPEKGYETLLPAFARVVARLPRAILLIAGAGPLDSGYRRMAEGLGLGASVRFLGFRKDLPDLMVASDIVALPSRAEAFGLAVAEALYLGTPVVASRVGGLPEIVRDGIDGCLVPPGDESALADAIVRLLGDPAERRRLAGAGRTRIAERFSFSSMVRGYELVYDELEPGTRS